jgi:hypothetical protein
VVLIHSYKEILRQKAKFLTVKDKQLCTLSSNTSTCYDNFFFDADVFGTRSTRSIRISLRKSWSTNKKLSKEAKSALEAIDGKHGESGELGKIIRIKFDSKNVLDNGFYSLHDGTNATPLLSINISQLQGNSWPVKGFSFLLCSRTGWMKTNFNKT